jgi:hypothetical protein
MNGEQAEPNESQSGGPPPVPGSDTVRDTTRHQPPPIPETQLPHAASNHEPPAIPAGAATIANSARHEPPPVKSGPPPVPVSRRPTDQPAVKIVVAKSARPHPVALSRAAFFLCLLCIPLTLLGSFWPLLRSPFWITSLMFAFLALCLSRSAMSNSETAPSLARLTRLLSSGFIFIAIIGLIAAAFRASIYLSGVVDRASAAIQAAADARHESNAILSWFLHKVDAILQLFSSHSASAAAPPASPTPTP